MFGHIDESDLIYVVANGGYVGPTTTSEIFYGMERKKEIISSEPLRPVARDLVSKIMTKEELLKYALSK